LSTILGGGLAKGAYTAICLHFIDGQINHRLRFGTPDNLIHLDRARSLAFLGAGQRLCYIRWQANEYGTQEWQLAVAQTISMTDNETDCTAFPGIIPGAEILLHVSGKTKVKRALSLMDALEKSGADLTVITKSWWRHLHNRMATQKGFHRPDDFQLAGGAAQTLGDSIAQIDLAVK